MAKIVLKKALNYNIWSAANLSSLNSKHQQLYSVRIGVTIMRVRGGPIWTYFAETYEFQYW